MKISGIVRSLAFVLGIALFVGGTQRCLLAHDEAGAECHDHMRHNHSAEFSKVPQKDRNRQNPFGGSSEALVAGRKLFVRHCSECHGAEAQGSAKAPNLHAAEVQAASPGSLFWLLSNGIVRKGMPDWSKLPEPQRWQIVTYLQSLKDTDEASTLKGESGPSTR